MNPTKLLALILAVSMVAAVGCSSTAAKLSIVSTKNVEVTQPHEEVANNASADDGRVWFLFIPFGGEPNALRCVEELLEENEADYLTNVEVTTGGWSILLFSGGWTEVEADAWARSEAATPEGTTPAETAPAGTTPAGTTPEATTPETTTPETSDTTPEGDSTPEAGEGDES